MRFFLRIRRRLMATTFFSRPNPLTYLGFLLWLAMAGGNGNYLQAHFSWICSPGFTRISPESPLVSGPNPIYSPPAHGTSYPLDPPTPTVALSVRVPASATLGQELEFRISVEN